MEADNPNGRNEGMEYRAMAKVEGGKLLKISFAVEDNMLARVRLHGDFFIHPEEAVEDMEGALDGCPAEKRAVAARLAEVVRDRGVEMIGISTEDIASLILSTLEKENKG
ncbi:MAG: hypothetical protein J7L61_01610 [Thermoplasmata archaeon]|nr:hypothetical protein [Thermoplasmata archaeon]